VRDRIKGWINWTVKHPLAVMMVIAFLPLLAPFIILFAGLYLILLILGIFIGGYYNEDRKEN